MRPEAQAPEHDPEELAALLGRVKRLALGVRARHLNRQSGQYRSRFRGQGMEFDEVRQYQAGDDIRHIDWNVTARSGRPFVKVYREERQLSVMLIVDASGSMGCGGINDSRSKMVAAAEAAAVVALIALQNGDKVGLNIERQGQLRHVPCRRGRNHLLRILREILVTPQRHGEGDLAKLVQESARALQRPGCMVVISDFLDPVLGLETALGHAGRSHQMLGLRVVDPSEEALPSGGGPLNLADPEYAGQRVFAGGRRAARAYADLWQQQRAAVEAAFVHAGCDLFDLRSDSDVVMDISRHLQRRARRSRRR
ncbi:MAG: DUF58 domain-containing protein [Planctomycetota bacterium]|nr:MAG: DUF58 domain-containing protein [Planctomycetota bacterium]